MPRAAAKTSLVPNTGPVIRMPSIPDTWNIGLDRMLAGWRGGSVSGWLRVRRPWAGAGRAIAAAIRAPSWEIIARCAMLRCDNVAPFGRPVVPLVNRITTGSSSSISHGRPRRRIGSRQGRCHQVVE